MTTPAETKIKENLAQLQAVRPMLSPEVARVLDESIERRQFFTPDLLRILKMLRDQLSDYIANIEALQAQEATRRVEMKAESR